LAKLYQIDFAVPDGIATARASVANAVRILRHMAARHSRAHCKAKRNSRLAICNLPPRHKPATNAPESTPLKREQTNPDAQFPSGLFDVRRNHASGCICDPPEKNFARNREGRKDAKVLRKTDAHEADMNGASRRKKVKRGPKIRIARDAHH
jgi:hypothetical protein